jgi:hypothetical protein
MTKHYLPVVGLTTLLCVVTVAGCGVHGGDLEITNDSGVRATVSTGDVTETVESGGAVVLLNLGCTTGGVTVALGKSEMFTVVGPVCPPDTILIHDDFAKVVKAP